LWGLDRIDELRRLKAPELERIVVAIDTAISVGEDAQGAAKPVPNPLACAQPFWPIPTFGEISGTPRRSSPGGITWCTDIVAALRLRPPTRPCLGDGPSRRSILSAIHALEAKGAHFRFRPPISAALDDHIIGNFHITHGGLLSGVARLYRSWHQPLLPPFDLPHRPRQSRSCHSGQFRRAR
jgi:hypothetical protein